MEPLTLAGLAACDLLALAVVLYHVSSHRHRFSTGRWEDRVGLGAA